VPPRDRNAGELRGVAPLVVTATRELVAPVLLFVWMAAFGVKPGRAALIAVIGTLAIWYVFYKLLRVPLPWGALTNFAF